MNRSEAQALETVEFALDGRMSIVESAHALLPLLAMNSDLASLEDFNLIRAIESETDDLPIGRVREHWHPDSLREKDRELARCERLWRERMISMCQRLRRTLLLRKLIVDRHLNVAQRQIVAPVRRQEVVVILCSILREDSVFPAEGREGLAYEGATIGRLSSGAQITHSRSYASHPQMVAEHRVYHYEDLDAAIEAFIDSEWSGGIDGISIEASS
jgi:hypothetical protein